MFKCYPHPSSLFYSSVDENPFRKNTQNFQLHLNNCAHTLHYLPHIHQCLW